MLLSGHTDTVPIDGNVPGRIEDGVVHGRGASDMKGGLAVMMELAAWAAGAELAYDLGLLFFPREELGPDVNPLPAVFEATPLVDEAALVICLEPTDNTLQLGCLGNINARVVFEGRSAHSARPWLGVNAIALALEGLRPLLEASPLDVDVEGLVFREVVSGDADLRLRQCEQRRPGPGRGDAQLPLRPEPDAPRRPRRGCASSSERDVEILQHSPAAPVAIRSPLVERLREASGASRCSRSRRGRTSPTSPRAASTRSTSAPAGRGSPTRPTSRSRSSSSGAATRR